MTIRDTKPAVVWCKTEHSESIYAPKLGSGRQAALLNNSKNFSASDITLLATRATTKQFLVSSHHSKMSTFAVADGWGNESNSARLWLGTSKNEDRGCWCHEEDHYCDPTEAETDLDESSRSIFSLVTATANLQQGRKAFHHNLKRANSWPGDNSTSLLKSVTRKTKDEEEGEDEEDEDDCSLPWLDQAIGFLIGDGIGLGDIGLEKCKRQEEITRASQEPCSARPMAPASFSALPGADDNAEVEVEVAEEEESNHVGLRENRQPSSPSSCDKTFSSSLVAATSEHENDVRRDGEGSQQSHRILLLRNCQNRLARSSSSVTLGDSAGPCCASPKDTRYNEDDHSLSFSQAFDQGNDTETKVGSCSSAGVGPQENEDDSDVDGSFSLEFETLSVASSVTPQDEGTEWVNELGAFVGLRNKLVPASGPGPMFPAIGLVHLHDDADDSSSFTAMSDDEGGVAGYQESPGSLLVFSSSPRGTEAEPPQRILLESKDPSSSDCPPTAMFGEIDSLEYHRQQTKTRRGKWKRGPTAGST